MCTVITFWASRAIFRGGGGGFFPYMYNKLTAVRDTSFLIVNFVLMKCTANWQCAQWPQHYHTVISPYITGTISLSCYPNTIISLFISCFTSLREAPITVSETDDGTESYTHIGRERARESKRLGHSQRNKRHSQRKKRKWGWQRRRQRRRQRETETGAKRQRQRQKYNTLFHRHTYFAVNNRKLQRSTMKRTCRQRWMPAPVNTKWYPFLTSGMHCT